MSFVVATVAKTVCFVVATVAKTVDEVPATFDFKRINELRASTLLASVATKAGDQREVSEYLLKAERKREICPIHGTVMGKGMLNVATRQASAAANSLRCSKI